MKSVELLVKTRVLQSEGAEQANHVSGEKSAPGKTPPCKGPEAELKNREEAPVTGEKQGLEKAVEGKATKLEERWGDGSHRASQVRIST